MHTYTHSPTCVPTCVHTNTKTYTAEQACPCTNQVIIWLLRAFNYEVLLEDLKNDVEDAEGCTFFSSFHLTNVPRGAVLLFEAPPCLMLSGCLHAHVRVVCVFPCASVRLCV